MNNYYYVSHFAAAYGEGTYGACSYNEGGTASSCTTSTGSTGSSPSASGSTLTNTGVMIAGILTLACLIIFATLTVRLMRRASRRKLAAQEVSAQTDDFNQK